MSRRLRVLAVDGDRKLTAEIASEARRVGWELETHRRAVGLPELLGMKLDAVVIDPVGLGLGGWAYMELLHREAPGLALIVCTDRVSRERRVRGLREGVEDWITKPMHPVEILARVEAVTRSTRVTEPGAQSALAHRELLIEPHHVQARISGENLGLTPKELDLLVALARKSGTVVEREELYRQAWGYSMPPGDRSVDVFVQRLRHKLERKSARLTYIHTHFRVGYRFEPLSRPSGDAAPIRQSLRQSSLETARS